MGTTSDDKAKHGRKVSSRVALHGVVGVQKGFFTIRDYTLQAGSSFKIT